MLLWCIHGDPVLLSLTTTWLCVCRAREGWKGEMTLSEKSGKERWRLQRGRKKRRKKAEDLGPQPPCLNAPLPSDPLAPPPSPLVPSHCCWPSTNLGVCFWGSCCVWWQCWRSPPPLRPLLPPGLHWRTWRWSWNSSRRSAHVSLCLHVEETHRHTYAWVHKLFSYSMRCMWIHWHDSRCSSTVYTPAFSTEKVQMNKQHWCSAHYSHNALYLFLQAKSLEHESHDSLWPISPVGEP